MQNKISRWRWRDLLWEVIKEVKKSPLLSSLMVIDGTSGMALSISKRQLVIRKNEQAIFVGSMTKIGKISRKRPIDKVNSFDFNKLKKKKIGIKLANNIKGIMPFVYFDTLQRK